MSSFAFILALCPLVSQVQGFAACDPALIANIENSGLVFFPFRKIVFFENQRFKYEYVTASDADIIQSAEIIFFNSEDDIVLESRFDTYINGSLEPTSYDLTFTDQGDKYAVDLKGFFDSPTSNNRVFVWEDELLVVAYYCSLDSSETGDPLFSVNTFTSVCAITQLQVTLIEKRLTELNNNVPVPLVAIRYPPTSVCPQLPVDEVLPPPLSEIVYP